MKQDMKPPLRFNELVVVGSSAGGIEALSILIGSLPSDFPAPIVLAQHLDPSRPSNLQQILERHSAIPIVEVEDKARLEPGKVYVVPANRHVAIRDGHLELETDRSNRPRPSVDLLLSSAAEAYGDRLIAVILTGYGSDGAAGAVEVKRAAGTVIIQNPETARYPSMPLALPPTAVDHIVDLEQIGPLIYDLCKGVELPKLPEKAEDALRDVLTQINRHTHIDFLPYKPSTLLRRISRRMAVTRQGSLGSYAKYVEEHPEEIAELVMTFLIKVTEFFRDKQAFEYLKMAILPELIKKARGGDQSLRFWSAGCATGEEPYSLAMLLADLLGSELSQWNIKIFATDLDEGAINFARRGLYPSNVLKDLPDDYRGRFFERVDDGYRISKTLRQMVIFGHQDLGHGVPFPRIDLVVCRNLLIYFKSELQQQVLDLFAFSLHRSHGYLFLGKAETVRPSRALYEQVDKRLKVYRCVSSPHPSQNEQGIYSMPGSWLRLHGLEGGRVHADHRIKMIEQEPPDLKSSFMDIELTELRRFNELIFRFLPTGVVVIDRNYRILTANGTARRLLAFRDLAHDQDFLHTVRGLPYAELRAAIDNVFREGSAETLPELAVEVVKGGGERHLNISIAPMQSESGRTDLAVITVEEVTEQVQTRRRLETAQAEQKQLLEELGSANNLMGELNKELQVANEQLQAANEEMMLAQEELQATNEELEATNEELQATNEELETNNEELQATNEELETTNEELTVRTGEMQETAKSLADERARLTEIVELAPFDVMILSGPNLMLETANTRGLGLSAGREIVGRPVAEIFDEPEMADLIGAINEAYQQGRVKITPHMRRQSANDEGKGVERYFVYTIVPTHDSDGKVDGAAVYAEDVTEQRAREVTERLDQMKLMVENADQVALGLYDVETTELLQASRRYLDVLETAHGYARDQIIGRKWRELSFITPPEAAVEAFNSVVEGGGPSYVTEVSVKMGRDGQEMIWSRSLTPIYLREERPKKGGIKERGRKGKPNFILFSAIEITEQILARAELERLNYLKDQFFSLASHELRTPLVPLMGYSEALMRLIEQQGGDSDRDKKIAQMVGKFRGQLKHLSRLTDDLLDVARLQSGKFSLQEETVNLAEVVEQAVEEVRLLSPAPAIQFKAPKTDHPLIVRGDKERLVQVVNNLLNNAIKHAPGSDQIDVRLGRARAAKGTAQIEVQDYGPGIAKSDLEVIFKRFSQVSADDRRKTLNGLGLGLFIAKGIIEQHGGSITAQSEVGNGSTFVIHLPLTN
jgi:two-component system, chemotaxis family, CheB/CheR fusion protein